MSTTVYGEVPIVNSDASIHLLGADLLARVLEKLNGCDVAKAECACRGFHEAAGDQGLWLHLIRRDFEGLPGMPVSSALEQSAPMGASDLKSQWLKCHMLSKAECIQWERVDFRFGAATRPSGSAAGSRTLQHRSRPGSPPSPREGHAAAKCGELVAVVGGFYNDYRFQVHLLDPSPHCPLEERWSGIVQADATDVVQEELIHQQRYGLSATTCLAVLDGEERDVVVVMGGFTVGGYSGEINTIMVLKWGPQEGSKWPRLEWVDPTPRSPAGERVGSLPPPRAYHSAVYHDKSLVVFGGVSDAEPANDIWVLDLTTWRWREIDTEGPKPTPRFGHTATVDLPRRPRSDAGQSIAAPDDAGAACMLVVGGAAEGNDLLRSGYELSDVHRLDFSEGMQRFVWSPVPTRGEARCTGRCHTAVRIGHKLVLYGGLMPGRRQQERTVATLDLETFDWGIPTLALLPSHTSATASPIQPSSEVDDDERSSEEENEVPSRCAADAPHPPGPREVTATVPDGRFSHTSALCGTDGRVFVFGGWSGGTGGGGSTLGESLFLHVGVQPEHGAVPQQNAVVEDASAGLMKKLAELRAAMDANARRSVVVVLQDNNTYAMKLRQVEFLLERTDLVRGILGTVLEEEDDDSEQHPEEGLPAEDESENNLCTSSDEDSDGHALPMETGSSSGDSDNGSRETDEDPTHLMDNSREDDTEADALSEPEEGSPVECSESVRRDSDDD